MEEDAFTSIQGSLEGTPALQHFLSLPFDLTQELHAY